MPAVITPALPERRVQFLENGDHLDAEEFLRRYEAMPGIKAELIDGIVYMASPVRVAQHGEPDVFVQTWLGIYTNATPGLAHATNSTLYLGPRDVPQPDALLRILPEFGGSARLDDDGYLTGPPELVVEIAASTASIDARKKVESYRRAQIPEYLLWQTLDQQVDWRVLRNGRYELLSPGADGVIKSTVCPGLWLNVPALLAGDRVRVMQTLEAGLQSAEHAAFVQLLQKRRG